MSWILHNVGIGLLLTCISCECYAELDHPDDCIQLHCTRRRVHSEQIPLGYPADYSDTIASANREGHLVIYSSTALPVAKPLIMDFRALHPKIHVEYHHMSSSELYNRFIKESSKNAQSADVLWSPAMNFQMKLVNDGYALTYHSPEATNLPKWAVWRDEAFGTTFEPVVFAYNKRFLDPEDVPQTHAKLAQLLTDKKQRFKDKVATYDIEKAGSGFLFATQDSMNTSAFWDLAQAMFATNVHLYPTTKEMLEHLVSGKHLIGYNLLGSYVIEHAKTNPSIGYVFPKDYTLVMSRIVFIAKKARNSNAAKLWINYLLSRRGQQIIANESHLSIRADVASETTAAGLTHELGSNIKPITVGPGLLTHLDHAKRLEFFKKWKKAEKNKPLQH